MRRAHWQTALKMAVTNEGTLVRVARHASVSSLFTPANRSEPEIKIIRKNLRHCLNTMAISKIKKTSRFARKIIIISLRYFQIVSFIRIPFPGIVPLICGSLSGRPRKTTLYMKHLVPLAV